MRKVCLLSVIIVMLIISIFPTVSLATIDTGKYTNIYQADSGTKTLFSKSGKIVGIVQVIGIGVAVVMLTVIAIKYIVASPNEKADLKSKLIPYTIGAVLLFWGSTLLGIIADFGRNLF